MCLLFPMSPLVSIQSIKFTKLQIVGSDKDKAASVVKGGIYDRVSMRAAEASARLAEVMAKLAALTETHPMVNPFSVPLSESDQEQSEFTRARTHTVCTQVLPMRRHPMCLLPKCMKCSCTSVHLVDRTPWNRVRYRHPASYCHRLASMIHRFCYR